LDSSLDTARVEQQTIIGWLGSLRYAQPVHSRGVRRT
jgi:hypothetical protein